MFKILIVEDDTELCRLFSHVLEKNGYHTRMVSNGQEALDALAEEYVDLIISDIMMPVMDGYELVRSLRKKSVMTPVLMITARDAFDDMRLGFLSGTADGIYGTATAEAVYNFQKRNGLTRDGVAGNKTLIALYSAAAATPTPAPTIAPVNTPSAASVIASASALHRGDNGTAVKAMQQRLIDLGYLTSGSADGIFGVKTYQALRDFQLANALYVDGVAGKNTIASLNSSSATGKNTARPNTTATPTPNISNDIGTTTKVSAENVVYEYWYSTVRSACRQYPYATVYDYSTGISWQVHMFSYGKHAEAEPLTAADTAKLEQAFGGNTWTPKAVWVIFADGTVRMATTHSMPHEVQHITDNNFPGHLCIHFPRTQAQVTAIGPYAMSHQQTVEKGWAETQAMIAN